MKFIDLLQSIKWKHNQVPPSSGQYRHQPLKLLDQPRMPHCAVVALQQSEALLLPWKYFCKYFGSEIFQFSVVPGYL